MYLVLPRLRDRGGYRGGRTHAPRFGSMLRIKVASTNERESAAIATLIHGLGDKGDIFFVPRHASVSWTVCSLRALRSSWCERVGWWEKGEKGDGCLPVAEFWL